MTGSNMTRWTVTVSKEADIAVRPYLAQRSLKKCDLSKFVEDAVRWRDGQFARVTGPTQIDELARVTRYPKIRDRISTALAGRLINELRDKATEIVPTALPDVSIDADDNAILAIARDGAADFLVTGDKRHLLSIPT